MTDDAVRHMVAAIATMICLVAYFAGYVSGMFGWWWTFLGVLIIYGGVYRFIHK